MNGPMSFKVTYKYNSIYCTYYIILIPRKFYINSVLLRVFLYLYISHISYTTSASVIYHVFLKPHLLLGKTRYKNVCDG